MRYHLVSMRRKEKACERTVKIVSYKWIVTLDKWIENNTMLLHSDMVI